jgi:hypothetical protein
MCPPPIYPQLPHFHNYGLAIPFYFIWKEIFEECFSPRLSSKFPSPQRNGALKKIEGEKVLKKEEGKRKATRVSANKKGKLIFWEEKNISTLKSFYVSPFSPPPSHHFQNPFQNCLRKFYSSFWTIL